MRFWQPHNRDHIFTIPAARAMLPPVMKQSHLVHKNKNLSYLEIGPTDGIPVLFFHGFPGSAEQALVFHNCLESHKLHIVSADRPGYGDTSPAEIFDFDAFLDSCHALTQKMDWSQFHVVGVSGGGPYARMMALLYPQQVLSCVTVCGLGLLDCENIQHMKTYERIGMRIVRYMPNFLSRFILAQLLKNTTPEHAYRKMIAEASETDRPLLREEFIKKIMDQSYMTATKQGPYGIHFDLLVYARRLQRTLGEFACPLILFHATDDKVVPIQMSQFLAQRIPRAEFIPVEKEGHFSLPIRRSSMIADKIVQLHKATQGH